MALKAQTSDKHRRAVQSFMSSRLRAPDFKRVARVDEIITLRKQYCEYLQSSLLNQSTEYRSNQNISVSLNNTEKIGLHYVNTSNNISNLGNLL